MDRGAWSAAVNGVVKSRTWLSYFTFTFHFHAFEKELATHSSVLAWRIPGTAEPGGLPSVGSHRVGHDWSSSSSKPWVSYMSYSGGSNGHTFYIKLTLIYLLPKQNKFGVKGNRFESMPHWYIGFRLPWCPNELKSPLVHYLDIRRIRFVVYKLGHFQPHIWGRWAVFACHTVFSFYYLGMILK